MARAVGDLLAEFDAGLEEEIVIPPSWNVAPTADVPILLERLVDGGAGPPAHIGALGPGAVLGQGPGHRVQDDQCPQRERAGEAGVPEGRPASRRCAVPADGYYEWKGEGRSKQPYYVHPRDGRPIVFAGLYEWWQDPSKAAGDPERWLLSTSILTTDSPPEGYAGGHAGRTDRPA